MKWYRNLRWKLVVSHLLVGVLAVSTFLLTVYFLTDIDIVQQANVLSSDQSGTSGAFQFVLRDALLVSLFAALEAALIVSLSVSKRIVEPLQAISAVSKRLAQGFYRERTQISSEDELAELSHSVNQLAATLEQTEMRRLGLLADVSHELRTPLATIGGYMEGLIDGVIKPDEPTYRLVLNESQRLQRLIEDLQLLSRAEAQQIPISPSFFDMTVLLHDLVKQFRPQFEPRAIECTLLLPETSMIVYADSDRVNQVLINLLNNALRYTLDGGAVTLRVRDDGEFLLICVEDTGIGIAPEHLPHLFERFYRVDKSRARSSGGNGIGLTIARHLVYAQGGDMWATSAGTGKGAQFYVTLPRSPQASGHAQPQPGRSLSPMAAAAMHTHQARNQTSDPA